MATMLVVGAFLAAPAAAPAQDALKESRQELQDTKARIRARAAKIRALQREMNKIATRIAQTEAEIHRTVSRQRKLAREIAVLEEQHAELQAQLDQRTREAYIFGPGAPLLYLITATSAEEAVNRIGFLDEMNRRDGVLARQVGRVEERLADQHASLERLEWRLGIAKRRMAADRAALKEKMEESRELYAQLEDRKQDVLWDISRIRPFAVCPVQGPHAISDSFGIWVKRSEKRGGDHVHQGNDISAATGTPIVAPFDGLAVTANNKMGGLAVKVFGDFGYVYNAHLSRFGRLGYVERGDVIGYVGSTGNAGGPHNHFEWHPGNGPAVDPYGFLLQVC